MDQRTDLWSLGVVLFELITGQRPFKGEDWRSTIYAITTHQAPQVELLRSDVPPELAAIVRRALAKRLPDRYQHAAPLISDLEQLRGETSSWDSQRVTVTLDGAGASSATGSFIKEPSILVLPFADLSPDKDNEYFSDGLTDEIITDLSQISGLRVISRTSAMLLKGAKKDVRTIGNELGVGHVLEGNVRKAGNNLRITAQLIDAVNDQLLWTNRFKGTLEDIFEIQEEVARAIVNALKVQLTPQEQDKIKQRPIDNPHAYECYLQARQEITLWTEPAFDRALQHLNNGLRIVGENALLYAGLGYTHWAYVNAGIKPQEHVEQVEICTRKVFELEPESAHGYFLQGITEHLIQCELQKSVNSLKRALIMDINNPDVLFWLCLAYSFAGRIDAAKPLVKRLLRIDPLNPLNQGLPGFLLTLEGRFDEALAPLRTMYEMDPSNPALQFLYGQSLAYNEQTGKACEILKQLASDSPEHPFGWMAAFLASALQGDRTRALEAATTSLTEMAGQDLQYSWFMAQGFALIDAQDEAVDWLENAVKRGFINHPLFTRFDPFLQSIHGNAQVSRNSCSTFSNPGSNSRCDARLGFRASHGIRATTTTPVRYSQGKRRSPRRRGWANIEAGSWGGSADCSMATPGASWS